jgi:RNA polymerase sigma factor (sigma-70 family)
MNQEEIEELKRRNKELGRRIARYNRGTKEYRRRYKSAYTNARRELFHSNMRLVTDKTKELNRFGSDYEDKCQEASLGFWMATRDFNPGKGALATKARTHMDGEVSKWNYEQIRQIHGNIPRPILSMKTRIMRGVREFDKIKGYEAEDEETAKYVNDVFKEQGIKTRVLPFHISALRSLESRTILDLNPKNKRGEDYDSCLAVSDEINPSQWAEQRDLISRMRRIIDDGLFNEDERISVKATLGIGESKKTYEETAKIIGKTRERVRQIRQKALVKLALRMNPGLLDNPLYSEALKPLETDVLKQCFGYYGNPRNFEEIAGLYGKSPGSVERLYQTSFKKIKRLFCEHQFLKSVN